MESTGTHMTQELDKRARMLINDIQDHIQDVSADEDLRAANANTLLIRAHIWMERIVNEGQPSPDAMKARERRARIRTD